MTKLFKVKKKEKWGNIKCYSVFGLNIFVSNQRYPNEFGKNIYLPFFEFLSSLMEPYDIFAFIGAPAINNWMNDEKIQKNRDNSLNSLIRGNAPYEKIPLVFYGGQFFGDWKKEYGQGVILKVANKEYILKILNTFMGWDAVLFVTFDKFEANGFEFTKDTLRKFRGDDETYINLLQEASFIITSVEDCQFLKIYSKKNMESNIEEACHNSERAVILSKWYLENQGEFEWNELEMCFTNKEK